MLLDSIREQQQEIFSLVDETHQLLAKVTVLTDTLNHKILENV